ncbi:hypothetical protein B0H14DRAFT_2638085 [Mycena olivaceomarginata]|nr:hypothetical protein B0H14DRAFT_2638085 [Mycena olivaceomarginata]
MPLFTNHATMSINARHVRCPSRPINTGVAALQLTLHPDLPYIALYAFFADWLHPALAPCFEGLEIVYPLRTLKRQDTPGKRAPTQLQSPPRMAVPPSTALVASCLDLHFTPPPAFSTMQPTCQMRRKAPAVPTNSQPNSSSFNKFFAISIHTLQHGLGAKLRAMVHGRQWRVGDTQAMGGDVVQDVQNILELSMDVGSNKEGTVKGAQGI